MADSERRFNTPFKRGASIVLPVLYGCAGPVRSDTPMVPMISQAEAEAVAGKRVVFAHQSVGYNILEGVQLLARQANAKINIVETRRPQPGARGIFHFIVGENGAPEKKIADYLATLNTADFSGVDIALMKFCYVDFTASTDARKLASEYLEALKSLHGKHPETRFVAVTAPLTTIQTGPKALVKILLGRQPAGYEENARRYEFNEALRKQLASDHLFDLARLEATTGTSVQTFKFKHQKIEALSPVFSSDGGHLNAYGKRLVAGSFLQFLAAPASGR
jgi:hypothetical protein